MDILYWMYIDSFVGYNCVQEACFVDYNF